jgi:hypothetical protein
VIWIGIDPGTHTGLAEWDGDRRRFLLVATVPLWQALQEVSNAAAAYRGGVRVVFEDARDRKWLPRERNLSEYRGRLMGAGSVKRDSAIWAEFLQDNGIAFDKVPPRPGLTKWTQEQFEHVTGWKGRTSNHARDAAMLVFGR